MTFKPKIWYPVAAVLSAANLVAVYFAAAPAEPVHATVHAGLALGFGLWAQRLRQRRVRNELPSSPEALELFEADLNRLREELSETQERLDFAERVLAQGAEARRMDPER
jgi:hypothetical protein